MKKVFLDFEASDKRSQIISIGAVYENNDFYSLVKPLDVTDVTKRITRITNIKKSDLAEAPSTHSVLTNFQKWLGNENYVIYTFGTYDSLMLKKTMSINRINDRNSMKMQNHFIDISILITKLLGQRRQISLKDAAALLNIEFEQTHNALEDAKILQIVYNELKKLPIEKLLENFLEATVYKEVDKFLNHKLCEYKSRFEKIGTKALSEMTHYDIYVALNKSILRNEGLQEEFKEYLKILDLKNENVSDIFHKYLKAQEERIVVINITSNIQKIFDKKHINYVKYLSFDEIPELIKNCKCVLLNNFSYKPSVEELILLYEAYRQEKTIYSYKKITEIPLNTTLIDNKDFSWLENLIK